MRYVSKGVLRNSLLAMFIMVSCAYGSFQDMLEETGESSILQKQSSPTGYISLNVDGNDEEKEELDQPGETSNITPSYNCEITIKQLKPWLIFLSVSFSFVGGILIGYFHLPHFIGPACPTHPTP